MTDPRSPYIVRPAPPAYLVKPGLHSHNSKRRSGMTQAFSALHGVRLILFLFGVAALGYYAYTLCDQYVYQTYENWAFDQQIAGRAHVTFADVIRERTPFGFLAGQRTAVPVAATRPAARSEAGDQQTPTPIVGSVLGKVQIARLNLSAVVREGVDDKVLSVAVGHVPSTALPGQTGNFAIAAHRDTLFRALKDIHEGDLVSFQSQAGTYTYQVAATKIVRPSDISVLRPDGGQLVPRMQPVNSSHQPDKLLTMITCYPFYYVGSAPKRFIVQAELVQNPAERNMQANGTTEATGVEAHPPPPSVPATEPRAEHTKASLRHETSRPRHARGFSHSEPSRTSSSSAQQKQNSKKRNLWHRIFHVS